MARCCFNQSSSITQRGCDILPCFNDTRLDWPVPAVPSGSPLRSARDSPRDPLSRQAVGRPIKASRLKREHAKGSAKLAKPKAQPRIQRPVPWVVRPEKAFAVKLVLFRGYVLLAGRVGRRSKHRRICRRTCPTIPNYEQHEHQVIGPSSFIYQSLALCQPLCCAICHSSRLGISEEELRGSEAGPLDTQMSFLSLVVQEVSWPIRK
ncbi:hypothetical protein GGR52DRAFT_508562 [Hypoxylon sp. FL1284]|nr:hypothetical protein GGR52DRAFT_508562 [Hypoxylon sp. FL1284]